MSRCVHRRRLPVPKLTRGQRRLLVEMADDRRVLLIQRHSRQWMGLRYRINAFPIRTIQATMVAKLAQTGYLQLSKRGYYELTTKGMLMASLTKEWRL